MMRDAVSRGTDLGKVVGPIMQRGELVSDELVMKMIEERLAQPDCAAGCLFDGFPRTLPQAEGLDRILDSKGFGKPVVVDLSVGEEKLLRRLTGRRTCSVGGEIYNVYDAPPKVDGICDNDGGKLVQRADDTAEVVRQRLAAYEQGHEAAHGILPPPGRASRGGRFGEHGRSKPCARRNRKARGRAEWSSVNRRPSWRRCIARG